MQNSSEKINEIVAEYLKNKKLGLESKPIPHETNPLSLFLLKQIKTLLEEDKAKIEEMRLDPNWTASYHQFIHQKKVNLHDNQF